LLPWFHLIVIVDYLNFECMPVRPAKTDSPLVVDAYAVLSFPIAFQSFQPIPGRNPKMIERTRLIQIEELTARWPLNGPEPGYESVLEQRLGIRRTEGLDHAARVLRGT